MVAFTALAASAVSIVPGVTTSAYAEKFCGPETESGEASGKTETEAKDAAMAWWSSRAGSLGKGYEFWDEAKDKNLSCHPGPFGTIKCKASAKPCLRDGQIPNDGRRQGL
ncbi:MAG: hypothetical protein JSS54_10045 [Proteobacteria bacterium]|nr:hypothetical protein [Pseudomonadota bacterium]